MTAVADSRGLVRCSGSSTHAARPGPESHVSAFKVDEDGPAVQQLLSHSITRGEVYCTIMVGHDQEPVALSDPLCVDGERRLVIALAAREKRHRELQGLVLLIICLQSVEEAPNRPGMILVWLV